MRQINPRLTDARRKWLQQMHDEKLVTKRTRGNVGYDCMQLGWTEWLYIGREDGEYYTYLQARAKFGDTYWPRVDIVGETITLLGEAVLREYNERGK